MKTEGDGASPKMAATLTLGALFLLPFACWCYYQNPRKAPAFRHGDIRGFGQRPTAFACIKLRHAV